MFDPMFLKKSYVELRLKCIKESFGEIKEANMNSECDRAGNSSHYLKVSGQ
ncbi:MAG: hypothetical protein JWM09_186 [Francisellaceae bacterium]|nr:hypothetical protein [Francisellaceae bacterium]